MKTGASICLTGNNTDGIPYRFIVMRTAYNYDVVGYVRIIDSNNIQIEAEADEEALIDFHNSLKEKFNNLKSKIHINKNMKLKEYTEFNFKI